MDEQVTVVIFEGGTPASQWEKLFVNIRHAVLLDNLQKISRMEGVRDIILVTSYRHLAEEVRGLSGATMDGITVEEVPTDGFHFGRELQSIVSRYEPQTLFYLGAASFPLIQEEELKSIVSTVSSRSNFVYTNNPQSSDLVAFNPAHAIWRIDPPESDNSLAISLRDQGSMDMELTPYSLGIIFDLDTPTDFMILGASPFAGHRTKEALQQVSFDYRTLESAKDILRGYYRDVAIVGRVGAPVIAHLNCNLKLRLRIFSEERGMKALGREASGEVEVMMAYFMEEVGLEKFFRYLERLVEAAFIDTRVLFAHYDLQLAAEERYLSDLGKWQELKNPWLRDFTRAAVESRIPVLLGGHSLVSGGLWLLTEELMGE